MMNEVLFPKAAPGHASGNKFDQPRMAAKKDPAAEAAAAMSRRTKGKKPMKEIKTHGYICQLVLHSFGTFLKRFGWIF